MTTATSPSYVKDLWDFGIDLARMDAGIDLERTSDDQNIPDSVDLEYQAVPARATPSGDGVLGAMTWKHWAGLALAAGLTYGLVAGKFK